jgi:YVTN family beta-propeller protein
MIRCTTLDDRRESGAQDRGQFTLLLNGPERAALDITFTLSGVNIISEKGTPIEIIGVSQTINSQTVKGRQVILAEKSIPPGNYNKIQLLVKEASLKRKNKSAHLALPPEGIEIPVRISMKRKENISIFLQWNVDGSITDNYMFTPLMTVKSKAPDVSSLLIYVTNEDSNNVSVVNRNTGEVVANIMVGEKPRGIAASFSRERSKIYVANSGSDSISVIDPSTQKLENELPVRFGKEPEGIAVGRVAAGNELIFVANFKSASVSVFDATSFKESEKIDVGRGPIAVAADPPADELTGTRFLSNSEAHTLRGFRERFINVYVANYNSNTVSVIRVDLATNRSTETITLDVDWNPISVSIDYPRGKVYVANYGSDKLSVIDIVQLIKGNVAEAVSVINNVAYAITGIIADPVLDRLYVLKQNPGQILILRFFDRNVVSLQTIVPPTIGVIPVGNAPRFFMLDPEFRKFYVVNQGSDNISVIDKTSRRQDQTVPVNAKPYGMALLKR